MKVHLGGTLSVLALSFTACSSNDAKTTENVVKADKKPVAASVVVKKKPTLPLKAKATPKKVNIVKQKISH